MVKMIFVDTAAFIALIDEKEEGHLAVCKVFQNEFSASVKFFTSDYVLDEVLTLLRCREKQSLEKVFVFIQSIEIADVQILAVTKEVFGVSMKFMKNHLEAYYSFTDCTSFVLMKSLKIKDVLTTDKHFRTAGFNILI